MMNVVEIFDRRAQRWLELGQERERRGQDDKAKRAYLRALRMKPWLGREDGPLYSNPLITNEDVSGYFFEFDLRTGKPSVYTRPDYAVKYRRVERGVYVEVGDGYRYEIGLNGENWDRFIRIIRDDELDPSGMEVIKKLMAYSVDEEWIDKLFSYIKSGDIREVEYHLPEKAPPN